VSVIPDRLRGPVVDRAGNACEYCRLPQLGQVARFPVDHAVPRSEGGLTVLENLALACTHCNAFKWAHTSWPDPESGAPVPLYNPRTDVWAYHFGWSESSPFTLVGKTACGRATIACLQINHPDMIATRALLAELGIRLETTGPAE
jgi:hypothetical protein